jgi:hypothetical protein
MNGGMWFTSNCVWPAINILIVEPRIIRKEQRPDDTAEHPSTTWEYMEIQHRWMKNAPSMQNEVRAPAASKRVSIIQPGSVAVSPLQYWTYIHATPVRAKKKSKTKIRPEPSIFYFPPLQGDEKAAHRSDEENRS